MIKRRLYLMLALTAVSSLLFLSVANGENPQGKKTEQSLRGVTGSPQFQILNINNITTWARNNGTSNHSPSGDLGSYFRLGPVNLVYEDGLVFGGKLFTDAALTTPAAAQPVRIGGSTYVGSSYIGTKSGYVTGNGATAVAVDPGQADVRCYRIRRDYFFMTDADYTYDAQTSNEEPSAIWVTQSMKDAIKQQYDTDWNAWATIVPKGAPYIERNGVPGFQAPPPFSASFTPDSLISGKYDEPGVAGADPNSPADQVIWLVYNDLDASQSVRFAGSLPIGVEIQKTVWGYKRNGAFGNIYFNRYRLINKGGVDVGGGSKGSFWLDSAYVCQWSDIDLGYGSDDLAGCDSTLSLGYVYNGNPVDETFAKFGLPPASCGYTILAGPVVGSLSDSAVFNFKRISGKKNLPMSSIAYFGAGTPYGHPLGGSSHYNDGTFEWYAMMNGYAPYGTFGSAYTRYIVPPGVDPNTKYILSGDPVSHTGFIDGLGTNYSFAPGDRSILVNSGPVRIAPGDTNEVYIAFVVGLGADRLSSISVMRSAVQLARGFFNSLLSTSPPTINTSVLYPTASQATIVLQSLTANSQTMTLKATLKRQDGSTAATVDLFDDGAHNDRTASDHIFGNSVTLNREPGALSVDLLVNNQYAFQRVQDFITTAGTVDVLSPVVFSDNMNSDGKVNPGENIRFGFTVVNNTLFKESSVMCSVPFSVTAERGKMLSVPSLNAGSQYALSYNLQDPNTYLDFTASSLPADTLVILPITLSDASNNHWIDTVRFRIVPLSAPIKTSVLRHIRGLSDGSFDIDVVNPSAVQNHIYLIVGIDSIPGTQGQPGFSLIDSTDGRVLLRNHTLPDALGHEIPVTDGFKVARGTLGDALLVGMKGWGIPSGIRRFSPAGGFTGVGLEGFSNASDSAAYDQATGTIGMGGHFVFGGTTLMNADYHNTLLKLAAVDNVALWNPKATPSDPNFSLAYRWLRNASNAAANPSFAPWIINQGTGYSYQDFNYAVPFSAWNMETTPPTRLVVGMLENNVASGYVDGRYWPGIATVDNSVARELAFIFNAPYSTTPVAKFQTNLSGNTSLPLMWVMTCARRSETPWVAGDQFEIYAYHPLSSNDAWVFNPTVTGVAAGTVPLQFSLDQNYPNPFNPSTTIRYSLAKAANVSLKIYNVLGQEVVTLVNERQNAGWYSMQWNARNSSSSIYFYRLQAGDASTGSAQGFVETKKMILLK